MKMEIPKTTRVTEFDDMADNNWGSAGKIEKVRINKQMSVIQFFFEDGRVGEVHACDPIGGTKNAALVVSELVSLANANCPDAGEKEKANE